VLFQVHLVEDFLWHAFVDIAGKILRAKDRVEADGIQVNDFAGVTSVLKPFGELLQNGMAKGLGIGVGKYGQDFHWDLLWFVSGVDRKP